jgi:hypothetical protein
VDVVPDVSDDAATDASMDAARDAFEDTAPAVDVAMDAPVDVPLDVAVDRPTDARADAAVDVAVDVAADVVADVAADVADARADGPSVTPDPCANGPGSSLLQFHFDGTLIPRIDRWNTSCPYSTASTSRCKVEVVGAPTPTMNAVPVGYNTPAVRVQFSVAGLMFTRVTLYAVAAPGNGTSQRLRAQTLLHGSSSLGILTAGFNPYSVDFTRNLTPTDDPTMTQVQFTGNGSPVLSATVLLRAIEICLE